MKLTKVLVSLLALISFNLVAPKAQTESEAELPAVQQLQAVDLTVYQTGEARQGAAADTQHLYAIDNFTLAKYEKTGGSLVARWEGIRGVLSAISTAASLKRPNSFVLTPTSRSCPWPALWKSLLPILFSTSTR